MKKQNYTYHSRPLENRGKPFFDCNLRPLIEKDAAEDKDNEIGNKKSEIGGLLA